MIEEKVVIEVLEEEYPLESFSLDDIPDTLFKWELGGITDPLGQLASWIVETLTESISELGLDIWGWLTTIKDQIISGIEEVINSVISAIEETIDSISEIVSQISEVVDSLGTYLEDAFTSLEGVVSNLGTTLTAIVTAIQSSVSDLISSVQDLGASISSFVSTVINQISSLATSVYQNIASFSQTIVSTVSGAISTLQSWIQQGFTTISSSISSFSVTLLSFGEQILSIFNTIGTEITNLANKIVIGISQTWVSIQKFMETKYNQLATNLKDVGLSLQGFVNPLVQIAGIVTNLPNTLSKWKDSIMQIGMDVFKTVSNIGKGIIDYIKSFINWLQETFNSLMQSVYETLITPFQNAIKSPLAYLSKALKNLPKGKGEADILSYIAMGYSVEWAKQMAGVAVAEAVGEASGEQEIDASPLGIGGKIKIKLGAWIKTLASYFRKILFHTLKYSLAGLAIWTLEPAKYYVYERLRNTLPVQLPTTHEMIEYTRRRMPTKAFDAWIKKAREIMALRGFNDVFINAVFTKVEDLPSEVVIKIRDRFGVERVLPTSAVYDLPSASDFARMMVRDIIFLDGFKTAMATRGMIPDIAKMYYLLHFKYPPMEKLYEFICRCSAGFAWVDQQPVKEEDLGVEGVAPTALNAIPPNLGQVFDPNKVIGAIKSYSEAFLTPYAKWHDYAPFAYVPGFTSDRLITIDMMADVPMRIDGRWMYKWGIINEYDVFRIATARGMHPRWLEPITVAECMNALAEERTYARTGVLNVFKEGFSTEKQLKETLSNLTKINILGKERVVKFLEGEVKLLSLRAKYDRALDILRDYQRDLFRAFEENVVAWNNITNSLKATTEALAKGLGISLALDEEYYKLYKPVAEALKSVYTVRRIRYWLRYMLRTILLRFQSGYISKSEVRQIVNDIARHAKLTSEEVQALLEIGDAMLAVFNREMIARGILRKLSRGVITVDQAKKRLKELGLDDDVIDAMIEYNAKTYTLSLSQLISYMEYVPIPKEMLEKKLELLGVPEDEAKLVPAYAIARELSSEVGRLVTELITDYANGLITKDQLKKELDNIATLWGKARQLGVDWVILSPQEREILILLAEKRRERQLAKEAS